jgi:hypothetical protein
MIDLSQCLNARRRISQNHVRSERNQLRGILLDGFVIHAPAMYDAEIPSVDPAQPTQRSKQGIDAALSFRITFRKIHEYAEAPHLLVLGERRQWPNGRRRADKRYEIPPPHSMTSSASADSVFGTVRFIALAVFRLSTNK